MTHFDIIFFDNITRTQPKLVFKRSIVLFPFQKSSFGGLYINTTTIFSIYFGNKIIFKHFSNCLFSEKDTFFVQKRIKFKNKITLRYLLLKFFCFWLWKQTTFTPRPLQNVLILYSDIKLLCQFLSNIGMPYY